MTARERDPQGVSDPPADLTRIAAIRERLELGEDGTPIYLHAEDCPSFCDYACNSGRRQTRDALDALAWLLARLAPATPAGAATAAELREALFRAGPVTLHSGDVSNFKIDCDALTDSDWEALANMLGDRVGRFGHVEGIPRGGLKLAAALKPLGSKPGPVLIVDDVLTTGASMEAARTKALNDWPEREVKGAVVFARGPAPAWVTALFVLTPAPASAERSGAASADAATAEHSEGGADPREERTP